jgi:MFS family permease
VSFAFFVVFSAIAAASVNMVMFIAFCLLMSGAAGPVQSVGSGAIADMWEPKERGKALGIFMLDPLCGPGLTPIIDGALAEALGLGSIQWFLTVFGGVVLALILFCLPETIKRKATRSDYEGPKPGLIVGSFLFSCVKPLRILSLLRHPAIFVAVYAAGISFGVLFVGYVELQAIFPFAPYNYGETVLGLFYLDPTIGYAIASVLGGRWLECIMERDATKAGRVGEDGNPRYLPEDRMKEKMWIGAIIYPACFIWFGWAIDKDLHWAVATVPLVSFGVFGMIFYGAIATPLTEFTPNRTSSDLALNNFVRNILSFIAAVVTQPLTNAMGVGWTITMVSLLSLVTILPAIALLQFRCAKWRVTMDRKLNSQKNER